VAQIENFENSFETANTLKDKALYINAAITTLTNNLIGNCRIDMLVGAHSALIKADTIWDRIVNLYCPHCDNSQPCNARKEPGQQCFKCEYCGNEFNAYV
jgi:hypothetical protein